MHLTILGATGPSGRPLLDQALDAGHHVTALVRDPARLRPERRHERLKVEVGDATSTEDLIRAMTGSEAVLSALGPAKDFKSDLAGRVIRALLPAARTSGVNRVVLLSALGVGDSIRYTGIVPKLVINLLMKELFADKAEADAVLRSSSLDWTLVYPSILTNGPRTGKYTAVETPRRKVSTRISREDLAEFMLQQVNSTEWSRRTAILTD
ncbi:NAD(P)-dependent oxidoreductase [Streptomyces sp. GbtcB7]|uniref:NAD(P)-dependent oxidoreductase n=1 Tax=Streptomyces sp. GbtcB7 TaxID=2824752 RepID=UPI001C2F74D6|nr:NAD(P)-binding oxidoreductase [Streptomyces sp. GbtcB7]